VPVSTRHASPAGTGENYLDLSFDNVPTSFLAPPPDSSVAAEESLLDETLSSFTRPNSRPSSADAPIVYAPHLLPVLVSYPVEPGDAQCLSICNSCEFPLFIQVRIDSTYFYVASRADMADAMRVPFNDGYVSTSFEQAEVAAGFYHEFEDNDPAYFDITMRHV
jgi:hypothetical protein